MAMQYQTNVYHSHSIASVEWRTTRRCDIPVIIHASTICYANNCVLWHVLYTVLGTNDDREDNNCLHLVFVKNNTL